MKKCPTCKESKSFDLFHKNRSNKDGFSWECKKCVKKSSEVRSGYKRVNQYGLEAADYDKLLEAQEGRCAVCQVDLVLVKSVIDHDHDCCPNITSYSKSCGKCVRGILCVSCNTGLGMFKDSILALRAAIFYLESSKYFTPQDIELSLEEIPIDSLMYSL